MKKIPKGCVRRLQVQNQRKGEQSTIDHLKEEIVNCSKRNRRESYMTRIQNPNNDLHFSLTSSYEHKQYWKNYHENKNHVPHFTKNKEIICQK
jgi:hypothetical protein